VLHEEKAARGRALAEQQAAFDRSSAEAEQRRAELETAVTQESATRQRAEAQLLNERAARQRADAEYAAAVQKAVADQRVAADQFAAQRLALQSSIAQEVSRRKAVETALANNRSELAALHQTLDHVHRAENDNRCRYERTPIGLWRCSRDRSILQVNHALIALLQYKSADELLAVDFSTVFESPGELQWIVDRCLASQSTETLETTWRTKRGATIAVRLIGTATSPDVVDLVAIDLTSVRALEERLRKSQRMESVARYASEIAVTCDKLLRRVKYQGQQWLTQVDSDSAHLGAIWLDDVDRAAGFLKRLTVYGEEQRKAPELVDIKDVLRDLAPILKRVAGSNVAIVTPKVMASYKLDLDIDRVERILVNVAAYGRQRMPAGGRLMIEVGAVVLDRTFVEKRPNVRPGPYVVLTVAAMKGATPPQWSIVRGATSGIGKPAPQVVTLDVELGALEGIVSDCGGHLWIGVEPGGNMELRIHLPRRMLDNRLPARLAGRLGWSKLAGVGT
jgi:PAS domain-containing protein